MVIAVLGRCHAAEGVVGAVLVLSVDQAPGAFTLPGIANLNLYAFQRAMVGLSKRGESAIAAQAMAEAIIEAAEETGIRLTLLPVLYQSGGFDDRSLFARQRRFGHALDEYLRLFDTLRRKESRIFRTGLAFHSLRALAIPAMREVLEALDAPGLPVHLHIAEQAAEVMDCLAAHGQRPVQRLLD